SAIVLRFQRPLDGAGQQAGNLVDLGRAFRADIDLGASLAGNGVDAGAPLDDSEVVRRSRAAVARKAIFGKVSNRPRESVHRVGDSVVAPTVSARACKGEVEPSAGQRLRGDGIGGGPVQNQERPYAAAGGRLAAEITHAAQV